MLIRGCYGELSGAEVKRRRDCSMSAASARNPHGGKHPAERAAARPAVHYSRQLCTRAGPTVAARAARPPGRLLTTITIFGFPSVRPGFSPGAAPDSAEQVFRWYSRDRGLTNCSVFWGRKVAGSCERVQPTRGPSNAATPGAMFFLTPSQNGFSSNSNFLLIFF